jgi:hypothetical protein
MFWLRKSPVPSGVYLGKSMKKAGNLGFRVRGKSASYHTKWLARFSGVKCKILPNTNFYIRITLVLSEASVQSLARAHDVQEKWPRQNVRK